MQTAFSPKKTLTMLAVHVIYVKKDNHHPTMFYSIIQQNYSNTILDMD